MASLNEFVHRYDWDFLGDRSILDVHTAVVPPIGLQLTFGLFPLLLLFAGDLGFVVVHDHTVRHGRKSLCDPRIICELLEVGSAIFEESPAFSILTPNRAGLQSLAILAIGIGSALASSYPDICRFLLPGEVPGDLPAKKEIEGHAPQPHFQILVAINPFPAGRNFRDESKSMAWRRAVAVGLGGAGAVTGFVRRLESRDQSLGDSPKMMSFDIVAT